jgi:ABC-type glycerol-3-phosphate transport system permease component
LLLFAPTLNSYFSHFPQNSSKALSTVSRRRVTTILAIGIGVFAAYPLSRLQFRSRDQILLWILSLRMMPTVAIVVPFYLILYRLGLLDTLLGLVCVYLSFSLPFAIWMLVGFFRDLPRELDDAALVAAATISTAVASPSPDVRPRWRSSPFSFVFAWNELILALMLTEVDAKTVPVAIVGMVQPDDIPWGQIRRRLDRMLLPMMIVVFAPSRSNR